jgi:hypothetical protein
LLRTEELCPERESRPVCDLARIDQPSDRVALGPPTLPTLGGARRTGNGTYCKLLYVWYGEKLGHRYDCSIVVDTVGLDPLESYIEAHLCQPNHRGGDHRWEGAGD